METYPNKCYQCQGTVEGPLASGWYRCQDCGADIPPYHIQPLKYTRCPTCGGHILEGETGCINCVEDRDG